jgi:hypothetical protein
MSMSATPSGEVVRARPRRARVACAIAATAVIVVFTLVATGLRGPMGGDSRGIFTVGDQVAMIVLGVLVGLGILSFARPRLEADEHGLRIRNIVGGYELPWGVVREIRFGFGAPWVTLELADDETVAVLAVQAVDKEYAVAAVRGLRRLLAAHNAAGAPVAQPGAPPTGASGAPSTRADGGSCGA